MGAMIGRRLFFAAVALTALPAHAQTSDPKFVEQSTVKMLETAGSNHIEVVEE